MQQILKTLKPQKYYLRHEIHSPENQSKKSARHIVGPQLIFAE